MVDGQRARGVFAREGIALRIQTHLGCADGHTTGLEGGIVDRENFDAIGRVARLDRPVRIRDGIIDGEVGGDPRINRRVVKKWFGTGIVNEAQGSVRRLGDTVINPPRERGQETVIQAAGAGVVAQLCHRVDGVFVEVGIPIVRVEHLLIGRRHDDTEIPASTQHIEDLGVAHAEIGTPGALSHGRIALGPRGKIATGRSVAGAAAFRHREGRTGFQVDLTTERVGAFVSGLAVDDFDLLIVRCRERVQRGGAAIATDTGGGHAIDVQAGVASRLTADTDIIDQHILVRRESDSGQAGSEFTDVLGRENAPLIERGDVFHIEGIALFGDRERLPFLDRSYGERLHHENIRGL